MIEVFKDGQARVNPEMLASLERRLAIAKDRIEPGIHLGMTATSAESHRDARAELDAAAREILHSAAEPIPVRIHAHAESLPLFRLCQAVGVEPPPDLKVAAEQGYRFDLIQVIFSVFLPVGQFPASAALTLQLTDNVRDATRSTRPVRLFPASQHKDLFRVDLEGGVGLDAHMDMTVPLDGQNVLPFGTVKAKVDADLKAKFVFGPFSYRFRKALIEVRGESDPRMDWRYNCTSEMMGTNEFKHIFVLKIPQEATKVTIDAIAGVVPCRRPWWTLWLVTRALPEATDRQVLEVELPRA